MKPVTARSNIVRGIITWCVLLPKRLNGGKYSRRYFKTKAEAEKYARKVNQQIQEVGCRFSMMSLVDRLEAMKILEFIRKHRLSCQEAIERIASAEIAPGNTISGKALTVKQAFEEFIEFCKDSKFEDVTIREYKSHLSRFARSHADQAVHAVNKELIKKWLDSIGVEGQTRSNYITSIRRFFNYLIDQDYLEKNPANKVPKPKVIRKTPGILTVQQIQAFVELLLNKEPRLLAPVVLSLFAGIRVCELMKLNWECISMSKRKIFIDERCAKVGRHRIIPMTENLYAWLSLCENRTGPVVLFPTQDNYFKTRRAIALLAGITKWPHNALRHSFASYSWAVNPDEKTIASQMGNSPYMVHRHYKAVLEDTEGQKFFNTTPKASSKKVKKKN